MDTQPYDNMHNAVSEALLRMWEVRRETQHLSEVTRRTGKIKTASWRVDQALDKLAHEVFLHQKQTRRAAGK